MSGSAGRRWLNWLNVVVMSVLMAAVLVGVNLIAHTRYARIDMTTDKVWEISPQSRQILNSVKRKIDIYVNAVIDPRGGDRSLPEGLRRTYQLLTEMKKQNALINHQQVLENAQEQMKFVSQMGQLAPNVIYFLYDSGQEKPVSRAISVTDLYQANPNNGEIVQYFGESRIISTIAQLVSDRKLKIYATTEHKELPPQLAERRGMSVLAGRLAALENAEFKPLNLQRDKAVPDDADLVFIAWPATDFTTVETDALTKYWQRGGRLFVAVYPVIPDELAEFRKFLETCGIRLNRDIVLDASRETNDWAKLVVHHYTRHPVNQAMGGWPFIFAASCSVDAQAVNKRMQAVPLFLSGEKCWTETDLPPKAGSHQTPGERWGPVPLAAASEEIVASDKRSRIIVWGSVVPLMNEMNLVQDMPNEDTLTFILNNFRWVMDREYLIAAPQEARQPRMKPFAPGATGETVIGWISLAGVPLLGVVLGILALYFRRK